jgi:hypothetical protein
MPITEDFRSMPLGSMSRVGPIVACPTCGRRGALTQHELTRRVLHGFVFSNGAGAEDACRLTHADPPEPKRHEAEQGPG